jgi:hypothetical protein
VSGANLTDEHANSDPHTADARLAAHRIRSSGNAVEYWHGCFPVRAAEV